MNQIVFFIFIQLRELNLSKLLILLHLPNGESPCHPAISIQNNTEESKKIQQKQRKNQVIRPHMSKGSCLFIFSAMFHKRLSVNSDNITFIQSSRKM